WQAPLAPLKTVALLSSVVILAYVNSCVVLRSYPKRRTPARAFNTEPGGPSFGVAKGWGIARGSARCFCLCLSCCHPRSRGPRPACWLGWKGNLLLCRKPPHLTKLDLPDPPPHAGTYHLNTLGPPLTPIFSRFCAKTGGGGSPHYGPTT